MAYKKRFYRRRSFRRRSTPWYRRKYSVGQLATKAIKGVNYLRGLVNSERFYIDTTLPHTAPTAAASTITPLHNIVIGDHDNNRTGNSIFVKSLTVRGTISLAGSLPQAAVRLLVVRDKQQVSDTTPAVNAVLEYPNGSAGINSYLNTAHRGRFDILFDRRYTLATGGKNILAFNKTIPMRSHIRYNGALSTDVQKNGLYFICITTNSTGSDLVVNGMARMYYHDN